MDADVIVVLGAKVGERGQPGAVLSRRLEHALRSFRQGKAAELLCCGGKAWPGGVEARVMWNWLVERGVPEQRVYIEPLSQNTWENAVFSAVVARTMGWRTAALVTCAWHMPRARRAFLRAGWRVQPIPVIHRARGPFDRLVSLSTELISRGLDRGRYHLEGWLR